MKSTRPRPHQRRCSGRSRPRGRSDRHALPRPLDLFGALAIAGAALLCGACDTATKTPLAGTSDAAPLSPACAEASEHSDIAWIQDKVFTPSCAFSGCHKGARPEAALDLTAGMAEQNLVGVAAREVPGAIRVLPGSPEDSLLVVLLRADPLPVGTERMPRGGPPLCDEKIAAIERWIRALPGDDMSDAGL